MLTWAKEKNPKVQTYILSFGDYEKGMLTALKYDFDGISFKSYFRDTLDVDKMSLLHKKGLKLMAWTLPDSSFAAALREVKVDIIQVYLY